MCRDSCHVHVVSRQSRYGFNASRKEGNSVLICVQFAFCYEIYGPPTGNPDSTLECILFETHHGSWILYLMQIYSVSIKSCQALYISHSMSRFEFSSADSTDKLGLSFSVKLAVQSKGSLWSLHTISVWLILHMRMRINRWCGGDDIQTVNLMKK